MNENDDVVDQLRAISETLSDRAISLLRDAVNDGDESLARAEKRVTQARRAVEKAIHLLGRDAIRDD